MSDSDDYVYSGDEDVSMASEDDDDDDYGFDTAADAFAQQRKVRQGI